MATFIINGLVFILIGLQFSSILDAIATEVDALREDAEPFHSPPPIDEQAVRGREHH